MLRVASQCLSVYSNNCSNKCNNFNDYDASVVSYTEGIAKWTKEQLERLNKMTRKQLTLYKDFPSKSVVDMVYVDRNGEDWLVSVEDVVRQERQRCGRL